MSPRPCSRASAGHSSSTTPSARTFTTWCARRTKASGRTTTPEVARAEAAFGPGVQQLLDAMTNVPAIVQNGRLDIVASNQLGMRALLRDVRPAATSRELRPLPLPRLARAGLLPRLGGRRAADRGVAAHRGWTCPVRPLPQRPRRRALHPQRRVPHAVGVTRRPRAPHRSQANPPPRRRRPPVELRGHGAVARPRTALPRVHGRTRLCLARRAPAARKLGRDRRPGRPHVTACHGEGRRD